MHFKCFLDIFSEKSLEIFFAKLIHNIWAIKQRKNSEDNKYMNGWSIGIVYANQINYKTVLPNKQEFNRNICALLYSTQLYQILKYHQSMCVSEVKTQYSETLCLENNYFEIEIFYPLHAKTDT